MKANTFQVEIEVPEGIPVDEVMKRFKNESRRVNTVVEVRRRRYFENHQDEIKRKEKQKHMNKRMAKFDKFVPTMEDRIDPHSPVPFGEMFGQGVDDMIGGAEFGPGSLFGSGSSLFTRTVNNPDSEAKSDSNESPVGRWGSRRASENGAGPRSKVRNDAEAPLTARARKAAQAANAQGKQSATPAGKSITAKSQPKQKQRQGPNNNGSVPVNGKAANTNPNAKPANTNPNAKPANANPNAKPAKANPNAKPANANPNAKKSGAGQQASKGPAPAPKKRWQTPRQKKTRAPGAASTDQATQAKAPSGGAPVQKKEPVAV